jgi:hypothetical protein
LANAQSARPDQGAGAAAGAGRGRGGPGNLARRSAALNIKFATAPYTLATLVKEQTAALMNLNEIDMPDVEREDAIADQFRDFANLVLGLPEDSRGFEV